VLTDGIALSSFDGLTVATSNEGSGRVQNLSIELAETKGHPCSDPSGNGLRPKKRQPCEWASLFRDAKKSYFT